MAHALSAMLDSGVPIAIALGQSAHATGDAEMQVRLTEARSKFSGSRSLSQALHASGAATPMTIQLVRAGEESGRLSSMLRHAASFEQKRVHCVIRTAGRMLEVFLLLTFASVVALIVVALLQAISGLRPTG
jgi:general secretion pathway protein F